MIQNYTISPKGGYHMVSSSLITAFGAALVLTLIVPILLLILLGARKKISVIPAAVGLGTFFVSQILLRMPILNVLSALPEWQSFSLNTIPYILVLSLSAGLFEESARLGGAALLKHSRSYRDAISFGLGHGLCEVFFLLGFSQINNLLYASAINSGAFDTMTASLPKEAAAQLLAQFTSTDPVMVYVAIAERVFAVLFHLFATVLIFEGLRNRHAVRGYLLALGAHAAFNFAGVTIGQYAGVWAAEGVMLVMAAAATVYTVRAKKYFTEVLPYADPA